MVQTSKKCTIGKTVLRKVNLAGVVMAVPFRTYGVLQIALMFILFSNFILTISYLLVESDKPLEVPVTETVDLVIPLMIASTIMLISSCLVFYILVFRARTYDLVGNLRIRKRSASFKVAFLSWILTGMETILRLIGLSHYKSEALPYACVPWQAIFAYYLLVLIQRTGQIWCLKIYEKNTRPRQEGASWMITRKSFLILMAFMNCYLWVLNVVKIKIIVDLTSEKMEDLVSSSVERIIYAVNRASTLAYHVESVQLFYKYYEEDEETLIQQPYEEFDDYEQANIIIETDSTKGMMIGFFLFALFVSMAGGSFLVRTKVTDIHYCATVATIGILLTIFCITLNTTLSHDNSSTSMVVNEIRQGRGHSINMFEDISSYMAGENVGHLRILLFYSICATSYHFLLTMKIIINGVPADVYQPVREGCKGVACISLTVFMFWMSHKHRKLRCWRDLNVMLWNVLALILLELIEETFEHSNSHNELLQLYALPLAIDFKIYVLIHTYSDVRAARKEYRQELRRDATAGRTPLSTRSNTPSVESSIRYN